MVVMRRYAKHKSRVTQGNKHQDKGGKFLKTGGEERARFTTTLPPSALHALDVLVTAAKTNRGVELQRNEALTILLGVVVDDRFREPAALRSFLELAEAWGGWGVGLQAPLPKKTKPSRPNKLGEAEMAQIQEQLDLGKAAAYGWRRALALDFGVSASAISHAAKRLKKA